MNTQPNDISQILPYGEMLRGFLEQPFIGKRDLKELLRRRGIFIPGSDKKDSIPILMSTLLSPDEFDWLLECQKTHEDNLKIITQTIHWDSEDPILDALPKDFQLSSVCEDIFANYNVVGNPNFVVVGKDKNHVKLEFNVERTDMTRSFYSTKSMFTGFVDMEHDPKSKQLKIVLGHTAMETKSVASKASSALIKYFKEIGAIKPTDYIKKILFSCFNNENRFNFLLEITQNSASQIIPFEDILDFEIAPDSTMSLPEGIQWMENRIEDLKINGRTLHKTFFLEDGNYHGFLHLHHIESKYHFQIEKFKGMCVVNIGFTDYCKGKNPNSELEVNVKSISFDNPPKGLIKTDIKKEILKEVENLKMNAFEKHGTKGQGSAY
jgi:hypothetical protein